MTEPSAWVRMTEEDPEHSNAYVQRFRTLAEQGMDLVGEARLVDAMLARGSRVLDAGCGTGRVGAFLHEVGHAVVGVDVDPVLVAAAEEDHPGPQPASSTREPRGSIASTSRASPTMSSPRAASRRKRST